MSGDNDEALARALQAQYDADHRKRSARSSRKVAHQASPSAPSETPVEMTDAEYARRIAAEERARNRRYRKNLAKENSKRQSQSSQSSFLAGSMTDSQYSRSMGMQSAQQGSTRNSSRSSRSVTRETLVLQPAAVGSTSQRSFDPFAQSEEEMTDTSTFNDAVFSRELAAQEAKRTSTATPATSIASVDGEGHVDDEEMARRLEQELNDEELARRYQQREEQRDSEIAARSMATVVERRKCTWRRFLSYFIPLAVLGGVAAGLIIYFDIDKNDFKRFIPTEEEFREEDPFNAIPPEKAHRWRNKGNGLRLEVLNALDERWHPFFDQSIEEWDNGTPDALELFTSMRAPDSKCSPVQGKLKVSCKQPTI